MLILGLFNGRLVVLCALAEELLLDEVHALVEIVFVFLALGGKCQSWMHSSEMMARTYLLATSSSSIDLVTNAAQEASTTAAALLLSFAASAAALLVLVLVLVVVLTTDCVLEEVHG